MTDIKSEPPTPRINAAMLGDIGLFGGMNDATLESLAKDLPSVIAQAGEAVVEEGDTASEMYIVISGELEVVKHGRSAGEVRVALFGPGDWFGEMAILDVEPRSATVRAVAPSVLLKMTAKDVERLLYRTDMKQYSLLIMNVARELSRRLRVADGILAQFVTAVTDEFVVRK